MSLTDSQYNLFEENLRKARPHFQDGDFVKNRRDVWTRMINRQLPVKLEEELEKWADGIDMETPDIEHAVNEHVKIMGLGNIDVATVCFDEDQDARDDVEDDESWLRGWFFQLSNGDWLNSVLNRGQTIYGVAALKFLYNNPNEPEDKYDKDREDYFRFGDHDEFGLQAIDPVQMCWGPKLDDPDVIIHECELTYWYWRKLQNQDGKYLSLDELKKVAWIGDPQPLTGDDANPQADDHDKIRVMYVAYREPGSKNWKMCEYVCPVGEDMRSHGDLMAERDVPAGVVPYLIVPSGDVNELATDPNLHYRPGLMMRTYVAAGDLNYIQTVIASLARKEAGDYYIYVDTYDLSPEKMAVLEELGVVDGIGQQRRLTFRQPDPAPGEYEISPRLRRKPESVKDALFLLYEDAKRNLQASMPSRFLSGEIPVDESKGAPATTVVNQTQAAQFRYEPYAKRRQAAMVQILENVRNCVIAWEEGAEVEKPYYLPLTDSYLQSTPDPKSNTYVNASKLKRHFSILVNITNETQQERLLRYQMADQEYQLGLISFEEWLRRRDIRDTKKKIRELNRERHRIQSAEDFANDEAQARKTLRSLLAGLNIGGPPAIAPPVEQAQPPMQQPPGLNQPVQGDAAGAGSRLGGAGTPVGVGSGMI